MANQFVNLPALAANGVGAAVDVSSFGALKTIVVQGSWPSPLKAPTINIEMNNDSVPTGSWAPVVTFRGSGVITISIAARWMRVRTSAYKGGAAPDVNMGGSDDGALFAALVVPAGNGVGAAVDVSTLASLKTLQIGNRFSGSIILELSEDAGGTNWAEWAAVQAPGQASNIAVANWARIKRVGVPANDPYGVPIATLGGVDPTSSSGGGPGVFTSLTVQELRFTPQITPAALAAGATNDYGPANFDTTSVMRQATDAGGSTLNGLVAQNPGDIRIIENLGPGPLTLANEAGASAAANRITLPGAKPATVPAGGSFIVGYDGTTARWHLLAEGSGGALVASTLSVDTTFTGDGVNTLYQTKIQGYLALNGAITPAVLPAGATNDYDLNPALSTGNRIRQATNAANSVLTGMVSNGINGGIWLLINLGTGTLTLKNEDAGSAAGNRFSLAGGVDRVIGSHGSVFITYDTVLARWSVVG
jgi:hypothetical protein